MTKRIKVKLVEEVMACDILSVAHFSNYAEWGQLLGEELAGGGITSAATSGTGTGGAENNFPGPGTVTGRFPPRLGVGNFASSTFLSIRHTLCLTRQCSNTAQRISLGIKDQRDQILRIFLTEALSAVKRHIFLRSKFVWR